MIFFPATEPADDSTGPVFVPDISLNRFDIVDSLSVIYRSIADSVNVRLVLAKSPLVENAEGGYALSVESMLDIDMPQALVARPVTINLGGAVKWNSDKPMLMSLSDFGLDVGTPVRRQYQVGMEYYAGFYRASRNHRTDI